MQLAILKLIIDHVKIISPWGPIAQLVELPAHNRLVPGSSPGGPTRFWHDFFLIRDIVKTEKVKL